MKGKKKWKKINTELEEEWLMEKSTLSRLGLSTLHTAPDTQLFNLDYGGKKTLMSLTERTFGIQKRTKRKVDFEQKLSLRLTNPKLKSKEIKDLWA